MKVQKINEDYHLRPDSVVLDKLPMGVYSLVNLDEPILRKVEAVDMPTKIYGDLTENSKRVCETFNAISSNLGVLLSGDKGGGKTLMTSHIAQYLKIPMILITGGIEPSKVASTLNLIDQEILVSFDEFDKFYPEHSKQDEFLSLFDGLVKSKKLYVLTSNTSNISTYLINRLGRVRYHFTSEALKDSIIEEVIGDTLENKDKKVKLMDVLDILGTISFDNLIKFIEEVNLYNNETPTALARNMNFFPEDAKYDYVLIYKGKRGVGSIYEHPLRSKVLKFWFKPDSNDSDKYQNYEIAEFNIEKCTVFRINGEINIEGEGNEITLRKSGDYKFQFK
jgi:hypothetical protein|tara:strand:- start:2508 stop:3515 length:1008 start_codon:yes stop_codon:yes gene_type:complete